jgi:hypothetical protein
MVIKNRRFGSVLLSFALLAACHVSQKPQDETVSSQDLMTESTQVHASEGLVGPDEAFFAALYLQQVFQYSRKHSNPAIENGAGRVVAPASVSAFDFQANFTEQRLHLMSQSLYLHGDLDRDGNISESEFASLKIDPTLLGIEGDRLSHGYEQTLFRRLAGADDLLQAEECVDFLRDIGPMIKSMVDHSPAQEQRRRLIKSWEQVLGRYDADQNGSLSLHEQRELRKDRATLISRLIGE